MTKREMYLSGPLISLEALRASAYKISHGPNAEQVTIHYHSSTEPCTMLKHEEYPPIFDSK